MTLPAAPDSSALLTPASAPDLSDIRSPFRMALRRFRRNPLAIVGTVIITLLVLICFGSLPWTLGPSSTEKNAPAVYENQDTAHVKKAPYWANTGNPDDILPDHARWMGTDGNGRDLRPRFLLGGAISLSIGICSALIAAFIGTSIGLIAGYAGGRTDALLMRFVDVLYGLPYILLVILMRVALIPFVIEILHNHTFHLAGNTANLWANYLILLVGIGAVSWLTLARVVRGQVLSLRQQPFVEAARALGFPAHRVLIRHILPNLIGTVTVYATLTVPAAILSESFLSFLGLGIQPPLPSWGNLASDGMEALNPVQLRWWLIIWPCMGLSLALLALNFVGDGLREAIDPKA